MGKVISFVNNKGGVAKTFSIFNIGVFWAQIGRKVLLIDLDPQATLTTMLIAGDDRYNGYWEMSIWDSFYMKMNEKKDILQIHPSKYENLDFVPSDLPLSRFERETAQYPNREYLLAELLNTVKDKYDYILVDCPPSLGDIVINAMVASDNILLVSTADFPSIDGIHMTLEVFDQVVKEEKLNSGLKFLGCLITKLKNDSFSKTCLNMIRREFNAYVIEPEIRKSTKINQAYSLCHDIFSYDPDGKGSKDYREAALDVLARLEFSGE